MGKTIRRKNVSRDGAYDWKDDIKPGKADAKFHGDTCFRTKGIDPYIKPRQHELQRAESREIINAVKRNHDEDHDAFYRNESRKAVNECWCYS